MTLKHSSKNRIAMFGHKVLPSRRGGVELVLTTLCPMLVEKGFSVTVYNRGNGEVEGEYLGTVKQKKYHGVNIKTVPAIDKKGLAALTSSFFAAIVTAFGPYDLVHVHAEGPCAFIFLPKLLGKKTVATIHGLDWKREKWQGGLGSAFIKLGERMAVLFADEIIVLNEATKDYFKEAYGRETVFIPNGVKEPTLRAPKEITEKWGLTEQNYILALSRLTEEKGAHFLIEAYRQLDTDKKLVIAGASSDTPDYVEKLHALAGDDENIIFTDFVSGSTLDELYSNAYCYVLPSTIEGMPLSLLEAMSYGVPCIGSNIPEIASVLKDKGLTFAVANVKQLKEQLQELLTNEPLHSKLQAEVKEYILTEYSWERVAEETKKLYQQLLNAKEH